MSDMRRREGVEAKVGSLGLDSRNVNVTAKIVSISETREIMSKMDNTPHRVADALIGDETGVVVLTLWDSNIEQVKVDDVIAVKNGYVKTFKGSIRLNVGRFGTIEKSSADIPEVNVQNNISEKVYEDRRGFGYGRRRFSSYRR
ncbi:MAG: single-stranded DNA-binding protein [Thermoproteota archaeon]